MVVASPNPAGGDRVRALGVPVIDLGGRRDLVSELIVRACKEYGFFTVVNHGVPDVVVNRMEKKASEFFSLPAAEKQRAGPASPLGYGSKTIGGRGDTGEVEYLILHTSSASISQRARTISWKDPTKFSSVMSEYVEAVRELSCQILELLAEGLGLEDREVFTRLIRDSQSDSLMRINHYPPYNNIDNNNNNMEDCKNGIINNNRDGRSRIGFGEHTDPQILTLLRSNGVAGLQMLCRLDGGGWVPVPPDPAAFCVSVGDVLQAMTNGRLASVRHRAMVDSCSSRLSLVYFAAPPLNALISPHQEMITPQSPRRYKSFTWGEYKNAMYSLRLGHNRLELFRKEVEDGDGMQR